MPLMATQVRFFTRKSTPEEQPEVKIEFDPEYQNKLKKEKFENLY